MDDLVEASWTSLQTKGKMEIMPEHSMYIMAQEEGPYHITNIHMMLIPFTSYSVLVLDTQQYQII